MSLTVLIILILVSVYLIILVAISVTQDKSIFKPDRNLTGLPKQLGMEFETIDFLSKDGCHLNGWFIPKNESSLVCLFCHGNTGNISTCLDTIKILHDLGLNVFIFDYRGYGKSTGSPSEKGTFNDGEAAWSYCNKTLGFSAKQIIIHGRSLGGGIASYLASLKNPKALILESTFTSIPRLAYERYKFFPVKLIARIRYRNIKHVNKTHCPILIMHSLDDEVIPFQHGRLLFSTAAEPKQFVTLKGTHFDGYLTSIDDYVKGLSHFIKSLN